MFEFKNKFLKNIVFKVSNFIDTPFFSIALAILELCCFYLHLDLVNIFVISFFLTFVFLFKKKLNCLLTIFLFMSSMISIENSPANIYGNCNFYFETFNIVFCVVAACIPVLAATLRCLQNFIKKKIEFKALTISTFVFGGMLLLNGLNFSDYNAMNFLFGLFMFFFFTILFFAIYPNVDIKGNDLEKSAIQVVIYGLFITVELIVLYIMLLNTKNDFNYRTDIFLGWGNENTIGMLLTLCLCFLLYLFSLKKDWKNKTFYYFSLIMILSGIIFTFSRQAYVFVVALLTVYLVISLIKKTGVEKRKYIYFSGIFCGCILAAFLISLCCGFLDEIILDAIHDERFSLWGNALNSFKNNVLFGDGFYFDGGDPTVRLDNIMPYCCHNTIFELIGACGLVGIGSYVVYRFFTVIEIYKNFTFEKLFPALGCFSILMLSLLDIHLFDFFGTALYVTLLALASSKNSSYEENKEIKNENKEFIECYRRD